MNIIAVVISMVLFLSSFVLFAYAFAVPEEWAALTFFVGILSADREDFRCYAVWNRSGLYVGEPIASRICKHLGVDLEPAISVAEAVACGQAFLFCAAPHVPPKYVRPRVYFIDNPISVRQQQNQ